jgi:uncharacterized protein YoaH (UPF0181 family)
MAVVRVDLEVSNKGEVVLKNIAGQLDTVGERAKVAQSVLAKLFDQSGLGSTGSGTVDKWLAGLAAMGPVGAAAAAAMGVFAAAATASAVAVGAAIKEVTEYGGHLGDLSAKTGIGTTALQELEQAGRLTGVSLEELAGGVTKLQKNLVDTPAKFEQLGLSVDRLRAMAPEEQLAAVAARLQQISDPALRAAAAMDLLGKSGASLLPALRSDLGEAADQAQHLGMVLSEDTVKSLDELGDAADTLGATWTGLWRQIGAAIARQPEVISALTGMTEIVGAMARGAKDAVPAVLDFGRAIDRIALGGNIQQILALMRGAGLLLSSGGPTPKGNIFGPMAAPGGIDFAAIAARAGVATDDYKAQDRKDKAAAEAEASRLAALAADLEAAAVKRNAEALKLAEKAEDDYYKIQVDVAKGSGDVIRALQLEADAQVAAAVATYTKIAATGKATEADREMMQETIDLININEAGAEAAERMANELERYYATLDAIASDADEAAGNLAEGLARYYEEAAQAEEDQLQRLRDTGDLISSLSDLYAALGGSASSAFGKILSGLGAGFRLAEAYKTSTTGLGKVGVLAGGIASIYQSGKENGALGGALGGAATGAALGSVVPGVGTVVGGIVGGVVGLFGGLFGGGAKKAEEERKRREEAEQKAVQQLGDLASRWEQFRTKTVEGGVSALGAAFEYLGKQTDVSADRLARLGLIGSAALGSLIKSGLSFVDAVKKMAPTLEAAQKAGVEIDSGKGFGLGDFQAKVLANQDLVNAAESWGQVIDSLRVTGSLTQETFGAAQQEAQAYFNDLIAGGFSSNQALAVIAKTLYSIQSAANDTGLAVDASTQSLIDQANTAGLLDGIADPFKEMADILKTQTQILAELARVMGGVLPASVQAYVDSLNSIPRSVSTTVDLSYGGDAGTGQDNRPTPTQIDNPDYTSAGGFGPRRLARDTVFQAHEGEHVLIVPKGRAVGFASAAGGFGTPAAINVTVAPQLVVNDNSMVRTPEGTEAFRKMLAEEGDRLLRVTDNELAARVRQIVQDAVRAG